MTEAIVIKFCTHVSHIKLEVLRFPSGHGRDNVTDLLKFLKKIRDNISEWCNAEI